MTTDNPTSLSFSLKESVWFQKGQEVAELLSISLYPDIEIQERDYEVVVKGALLLTGEYVAQDEQEEAFSLRELSPVRTIDSIYIREDGINELSHAFPLEISIPRGRVHEIADLYVTIETFDYEMPESGCLQLIADLSIHGLREEIQREEELVAEPELDVHSQFLQEYVSEEEEDDLFEPFELVERKEAVKEPVKEAAKEPVKEAAKEPVKEAAKEPVKEAVKELVKEPVKESVKEPVEEPTIKRQDAVAQVGWLNRKKEEVSTSKEEEDEFEFSKRDENALYLTKLFTTKEREEEFTKLRMYFVQQGDTIDSILERYNITIQQLTRVNVLDDLYVQEGEILYIPVAKSSV